MMVGKEDMNQEYQLALHKSLSNGYSWEEANTYAKQSVLNYKRKTIGTRYHKRCKACRHIRPFGTSKCNKCGSTETDVETVLSSNNYDDNRKGGYYVNPESEVVGKLEIEGFKEYVQKNTSCPYDIRIIEELLKGQCYRIIAHNLGFVKSYITYRLKYIRDMYNNYSMQQILKGE